MVTSWEDPLGCCLGAVRNGENKNQYSERAGNDNDTTYLKSDNTMTSQTG